MLSTVRAAIWGFDADDTNSLPLVTGACPAMALAALGSVLQQVGSSLRRDRRLLNQWLSSDEGLTA